MLCTSITGTWTFLQFVPVSSKILDTPVHWILCFVYTLITLDTVISCTCITATYIHWTSFISCLCTTDTLATITTSSWTLLFHVLYHCYTVIVLTHICTSVTRILQNTRHYYHMWILVILNIVIACTCRLVTRILYCIDIIILLISTVTQIHLHACDDCIGIPVTLDTVHVTQIT